MEENDERKAQIAEVNKHIRDGINQWADIIRTVFAAEANIKNRDKWVERLREARNLPEDQRMKVCNEYVRELATEIVSKTSDEELEEL